MLNYHLVWDFQTLSAGDLRDVEVSALVAAKLREFHNLDMPGPKNVVLWNRIRYKPTYQQLKFSRVHCDFEYIMDRSFSSSDTG